MFSSLNLRSHTLWNEKKGSLHILGFACQRELSNFRHLMETAVRSWVFCLNSKAEVVVGYCWNLVWCCLADGVFSSLSFFVPSRISVFLTVKWEDDCSQTEKGKEKTCLGIRPTLCRYYTFWNGAQVRKFQLHFWSGIHQGAGEWYQEVLPYVTIFERSYSFRFVNCFLSTVMG